jgi:hypothetical protein
MSREETDLAELVHAIPNNSDYDGCVRIGLAIYAAYNHGGIIFLENTILTRRWQSFAPWIPN